MQKWGGGAVTCAQGDSLGGKSSCTSGRVDDHIDGPLLEQRSIKLIPLVNKGNLLHVN